MYLPEEGRRLEVLFSSRTGENLIQTKQSRALIYRVQQLSLDVQKLKQLCDERGTKSNTRRNYLIGILVLLNSYCSFIHSLSWPPVANKDQEVKNVLLSYFWGSLSIIVCLIKHAMTITSYLTVLNVCTSAPILDAQTTGM